MTDVTSQHPEYKNSADKWKLVSDATAGQDAIKAAGELYLPKPNKADPSRENEIRWEQYLQRAVYYNVVGHTLAGLVGIAFRKWPEIQMPPALDDFKADVSGDGVPLIMHSQSALAEVLETGRCGILVDYPATDGNVSIADQSQGGIQPTFVFYDADDIINWRTTKVGSRNLLSMVVLCEDYEVENGFEIKFEKQYRVLRLVEGTYTVETWRKVKDTNGNTSVWAIYDAPVSPLMGNGRPWQEIPFQFIGSENNDACVDRAPLYDLGVMNIAHYRNSADYEDSVYLAGQPQVWMAGLSQDWVDMLEKKGIYLGSRSVLPLPIGGSAGIMQAQPNTLAKEAMDQKQEQMAAIGAKLIQRYSRATTATEVQSDDATSHSVLSKCCDNISAAYTQAIKWAAIYAGVDEADIEFSIPTEFISVIDAPTATQLMTIVQAGKMPDSDFWTAMRSAGFIDSTKTDDEIREELASQTPSLTSAALGDANQNQGGQQNDGNVNDQQAA